MKSFFIYKSSAGSGKTYTLVKEYLKLVLNNTEGFRHTLAITFTNKAAEEMKTRIINKLACLSQGSEPGLEGELGKEGIKGDIKIKAKEVLRNILHKYFYFSVMTIDSFFHKVIRAFAKELKLQFGFSVELEEEAVMSKVVDTLLDEAGTNKELTEYLEEFTFYSIEDNKGWRIDAKIKNLAKEINKERFWQKRAAKNIIEDKSKIRKVISKLFQIIKEYESQTAHFGKEAEKIMKSFGLDVKDFPYKGYMGWLINKPALKPSKNVINAYSNISNCWNRNSKKEVMEAVKNGIYEILKKAYEYYQENKKPYFSARELLKTIYMLGIFGDLIEKLRDWRDENRALLISDTNTILREVISGEASPFIYERIGNTYKNFLIDEFQDTSTFQWNNMLPLLINALSEEGLSMIVGDVKQSIYRWRNGNMMVLLKQVKEDLVQYKDLIEEKELLQNFRSKKEIVNFNNKFFARVRETALLDIPSEMHRLIMKSYEQVEQNIDRCQDGGYVRVQFAEKDEGRKMSASEIAGEILIETVEEVLREGYRQQDIFVLVRRKTDGTEAARLLIEKGYNVVSSESLLLTNSPRVKLIINLLKYITDNKNQLARTEALYNYQVLNNSHRNFDEIFRNNESTLFAKTFPPGFLKDGGINPKLYRLSLYELVENLIIIFGLNDKADAYLLRFLDVIHEYSQKNSADIAGFFGWWDENFGNYSIVVPAGEDAVNVMTIHKAKGLESPVVIVPYANWKTDAGDFIWTSSEKPKFNELSGFFLRSNKNLEDSYFNDEYIEEKTLTRIDHLNLLYVSFTRAKDRLYIIVPGEGSIPKLIKDVIKSVEEFSSAVKNKNLYEIGFKTLPEPLEKISSSIKAEGFNSTDFYSKLVIKPIHFGFTISKEFESINRGLLIHKALSYIKTVSDVNSSLSHLKREGLIKDGDENELKKELEEITSHQQASHWFKEGLEIKNEAELILPDGTVLRPDRIVIDRNKSTVIDFKSGEEHPEHKTQIRKYSNALKEAGFGGVESYLFYINERRVVEV